MLRGKGKIKAAKRLPWRMSKTDGFWLQFDVETYDRGLEDEVAALLVTEARAQHGQPDVAAAALEKLERLGPNGRAEVVHLAEHPRSEHLYASLRYLALQGDDRWVDILPARLEAAGEEERCSLLGLAGALAGALGNQTLVPKILDSLANDASPQVRSAAAIALQPVDKTPEVIEALGRALSDDERPVADLPFGDLFGGVVDGRAIGAIGKFLLTATVAAANEQPTVAERARHTLARIGDNRAAELVTEYDRLHPKPN
ncbi:MAG: hypothetical protein KJN63_05200 [Acidimicrobiia bacterium]|nr:hypothetical protein [Acidimicrobiia bacterium]